jgi:hypothetical protein
MKKEIDEIPDYDDDAVIKFTMELVPDEFKNRIDENKIQYILDVVYDYYDEQGFIEEETVEEASIDEEAMLKYVAAASKKDKIDLTEEEIQFILDCEYDYGVSIGIYTEE